jgi:hypothetical protein
MGLHVFELALPICLAHWARSLSKIASDSRNMSNLLLGDLKPLAAIVIWIRSPFEIASLATPR